MPSGDLMVEARPGTATARVLVVDDHALLRTGVANIINHEPDLEVVAEAGDGREAVDAFERWRPDVTLMDLRMPVMEGVEAIRRIRAIDPHARVVVLTTYDADEDIARALEAGAKAYILKDIAAAALVACIHDVLAGKTYLAPSDGRRPQQQGDRRRALDQRAHGEDASRPSIRKARRHQPHGSGSSGDAPRPGALRLAERRLPYVPSAHHGCVRRV